MKSLVKLAFAIPAVMASMVAFAQTDYNSTGGSQPTQTTSPAQSTQGSSQGTFQQTDPNNQSTLDQPPVTQPPVDQSQDPFGTDQQQNDPMIVTPQSNIGDTTVPDSSDAIQEDSSTQDQGIITTPSDDQQAVDTSSESQDDQQPADTSSESQDDQPVQAPATQEDDGGGIQ